MGIVLSFLPQLRVFSLSRIVQVDLPSLRAHRLTAPGEQKGSSLQITAVERSDTGEPELQRQQGG
jgi:hypothetical protein